MQSIAHWRRIVVALVAVVLLAAGCGDDSDETDSAAGDGESVSGEEQQDGDGADEEYCDADRVGGDITVLTNSANSGLDPSNLFGTGSHGGDVAGAFYGTVIRYDAETDTYEPNIAESWEPNEDNSEWTLTLRDDVTFGNGDPFTTEHVAAHLERMKDTTVRAAGMAQLVESVEIVDDQEMVVTMASPFNFPYMMSTELGWVPNKDLVEERGDGFHVNPVGAGAGAYEIEHISDTAGESLVLAAKDDWWGPQVCIESIDFQFVPGTEARLDAFLKGEADSAFVTEQSNAIELEDEGLLAFGVPAGAVGYIVADQGITGSGETAFNDVRVREAMQLALDYDVVHERLLEGTDPAPTSAIVPEDSPLFHGMEGPASGDPERAAELVRETVDEGVWDGSFTFLHDSTPESTDTAVLFEGMWEAAGMDVTLEAVPSAAARVIADRDFEVATNGFAILPPAPWSTLNGLRSDSPRQRSGFSDPDMDAAIDQLQRAVTLEENQEALAAMQEVWNRTFPLQVWRHSIWGIAAQEDLHGLRFGPDNTPYYEMAWLDR